MSCCVGWLSSSYWFDLLQSIQGIRVPNKRRNDSAQRLMFDSRSRAAVGEMLK